MPQLLYTPRVPFGEISPNSRSYIVTTHEYRIKFTAILRGKNLLLRIYLKIIQNILIQDSCKSRPYIGYL